MQLRRISIVIVAALIGLQAARAATLAGRVVDESGTPITKAAVVWWAVPDIPINVPMALAGSPTPAALVRGAAFSDINGAFQVPNLQAGSYRLCVTSLAQPAHLSSCEWRVNEAGLTLSDTSPPVQLVARTGAVLRFHISDPKGRLGQSKVDIVVSAADGGFAHARVASLTATAAELFVALPLKSQITMIIDAPFAIKDGKGAAVPLFAPSPAMTVTSLAGHDVSLVAQ